MILGLPWTSWLLLLVGVGLGLGISLAFYMAHRQELGKDGPEDEEAEVPEGGRADPSGRGG